MEVGGLQVGEVTRLGGVKQYPAPLHAISYNPAIPECTISYWMVTKHINKKNAGKTGFLAINALRFYTHLLLLLRPSVLWLSIVTFNKK